MNHTIIHISKCDIKNENVEIPFVAAVSKTEMIDNDLQWAV